MIRLRRSLTDLALSLAIAATALFSFAFVPIDSAHAQDTPCQGGHCEVSCDDIDHEIENENDNSCPTYLGMSQVCCMVSSNTRAEVPTGTAASTPIQLIQPTLSIPIPNLSFTTPRSVTDAEGATSAVDIPFIADYVQGIYNYAIGIAAVLAATMMMLGGLQYLMAGGDSGKVSEAKKRITDALVGLVLALGAYTILTNVSGQLVELKTIHVVGVQQQLFESTLGTTTEDTAQVNSGGGEGPSAGAHTPNPDCPVQFTAAKTDNAAYRKEFTAKIGALITATDPRERVVAIADAMAACGVQYGSCGNTAGTIQALAGFGNTGCLNESLGACNGNHAKAVFDISAAQRKELYGQRCTMTPTNLRDKYLRADCVNSSTEARKRLLGYFKKEAAEGRLEGWPDQWADKLQPGDYVVLYNGNPDLIGAHAVTFLGWAADGKKMQVVQGSAGKDTWNGTICVRSACGDAQVPLLYAWSPK